MNKIFKKILAGVMSATMIMSVAITTPLAEDALPTDDLLVDISFDETGTGTGSFTPTIGGTITEKGKVSYVDSYDGESKALSITSNAAGNYLELPKGIFEGKDSATFSFWIKPNSGWAFMTTPVSDAQVYLSEKYLGMLATSSTFTTERYNNTGTRLSSVIANGTYTDWQYVTAIFEGKSTKIYVNGKLIASDTATVDIKSLFTSDASTWIGHGNWGSGEGFSGTIDDFKIYGRAISSDEVATLSAEAIKREQDKYIAEKNCLDITSQFYLTDRITYAPNSNDINVSIMSIKPKDVIVLGASYDNGVLSNLVRKDCTLVAGDNSVTLNDVKKNDTDTVKVFVWDSLSGINPISDKNKVFQFDTGSEIKAAASVTNYLPSDRTVEFRVTPYNSQDSVIDEFVQTSKPKTLSIMDDANFSLDIKTTSDDIAYYKISIRDVTDENNAVIYDAGHLPRASVSFPDASPEDTMGTTMAAHDPSIFKDPDTDIYYAYNTDAYGENYTDINGDVVKDTYPMDTFKSTDLINWERIDNNFRIPESAVDFFTEIFTPIGSKMNSGVWAPDIYYNENDKEHPYWLYYSLSTNGSNYDYIRSAIGLVKGETPTGPWTDCGIVISSTNGYKTNAIDSNIYVDTNGDKFFVWGSFQEGMHQVKLTDDGLAEGVDYSSNATIHSSSKILGSRLFSVPNGIQGPEGPYMINNIDENYRYMFVSYGWLGTNYNIRIARNSLDNEWTSETATDPHKKLVDHKNRPVGATFKDQVKEGGTFQELWGYKMLGSYQLGDGITYYGNGHNSVLHDDDENWYLVEHCRKVPDAYAALQVRKMLWTDEGWPVVSPLVYAGETEQDIPKEMLYGTWDLSSVGQTLFADGITDVSNGNSAKNVDLPVLSSQIILQPDGKLGNSLGTWEYDDKHTVTLNFEVNGNNDNYEFYQSGDTMKLFVLTGYDKDKRESAVVMTGTDQNSIAQLAKKNNAVAQSTQIITRVDTTPTTIAKSPGGNPILGFNADNEIMYGGDPATLVDGDTVYLYVGNDVSTTGDYVIPRYACYSSTDMKNWKYEDVIMEAKDISWKKDDISAWASQVIKHGDTYYLYYCTWANSSTASGYQCIGVATSQSPTGPFVDIGQPLVNGRTQTTENVNAWDDIDPTVWVETVDGEEHRYLGWGNVVYYICELNEDMISVKDLNGDNKITNEDITTQTINGMDTHVFTEAPWIYRRLDGNGEYTGLYYTFFAADWREQMAYATTDDISGGEWDFGKILMPPTATSNTNHPAVIDFKDKTYFIYHNGSLPWGSGFRRSICVEELTFNADGSIDPIQETSIGLTGTASTIKCGDNIVYHEAFVNPLSDADYPLKKLINAGTPTDELDGKWEIMPGKMDATNENYVSIQSVNKPGLYICANDKNIILTQQDTLAESLAKNMTFKTVEGINGAKGTVSFESVAKPGYFLTVSNSQLILLDAVDLNSSSFTIE